MAVASPSPSLSGYARRVTVAIALVALALFLWKITPVLMLAFGGVVLATAVRAAALPLSERLHISRTWAVGIVFALLIALVIGGGYLFGKQIASETTQLWSAVKEATGKVEALLNETAFGTWLVENVRGAADPEAMSKVFKGTVTVFGGIADLLLVLFLALYFAVDRATYRTGLLLLLPEGARTRVGKALDDAGKALRMWLVGQLAAMLVVGLLTGFGLWLAGVPMAIPLGILSGILDFVPFIGPLVAAVPGILVGFSQGPQVALYAALVYLAVQFVEGNIVMPMAQKWAVEMPPVVGLLAIVAFGMVFGPLGLLFGMPLAVVTLVLVQRLWLPAANGDAPRR
jgi:predicted PurR-regulated permease PerM